LDKLHIPSAIVGGDMFFSTIFVLLKFRFQQEKFKLPAKTNNYSKKWRQILFMSARIIIFARE